MVPREIEAKFRVPDRAALELRLAALGASPAEREDESNLLLDDAAESLRESGTALRVRTVGETGLLTFKGPAEVCRGVKSRVELESAVADPEAVLAVLGALGFTPWIRYEKRRTPWRFADPARPLVVVDETPIGLFAEVEGEAAAVRALVAELGVSEGELLGGSYVRLYLEARAADPTLPHDMIFR